MTKTIYFVTGSKDKYQDVEEYIQKTASWLTVVQEDFDIREVQSLNQEKVAMHKADVAWNRIKKPLIIDDSGIFFEEYPLFPGVFTKYMVRALGFEGLARVLGSNNSVSFRSCIVYADEDNRMLFRGETKGRLEITDGPPSEDLHEVFFPEGSDKNYQALRELPEFEKVNYRFRAIRQFLDWYEKKET